MKAIRQLLIPVLAVLATQVASAQSDPPSISYLQTKAGLPHGYPASLAFAKFGIVGQHFMPQRGGVFQDIIHFEKSSFAYGGADTYVEVATTNAIDGDDLGLLGKVPNILPGFYYVSVEVPGLGRSNRQIMEVVPPAIGARPRIASVSQSSLKQGDSFFVTGSGLQAGGGLVLHPLNNPYQKDTFLTTTGTGDVSKIPATQCEGDYLLYYVAPDHVTLSNSVNVTVKCIKAPQYEVVLGSAECVETDSGMSTDDPYFFAIALDENGTNTPLTRILHNVVNHTYMALGDESLEGYVELDRKPVCATTTHPEKNFYLACAANCCQYYWDVYLQKWMGDFPNGNNELTWVPWIVEVAMSHLQNDTFSKQYPNAPWDVKMSYFMADVLTGVESEGDNCLGVQWLRWTANDVNAARLMNGQRLDKTLDFYRHGSHYKMTFSLRRVYR